MARRKNIEHLYHNGSSLCLEKGRRDYMLIALPDEEMAKKSDKYGDYGINHVRCVEKCISDAVRHYGNFTDEDVEHIKAMKIGDNWLADEHSLIIRVA